MADQTKEPRESSELTCGGCAYLKNNPHGYRYHCERHDHGRSSMMKRCDDYTKKGPADLTLKLNVDVSDALTGLKALRREADRAVAALKALEEALGSVSLRHVRVGDYEETEILPARPEVSE